MANSINHKHIVGGLHISYNIERAFPDASHSNIVVGSECIFGLFDKNNQTIIEAFAENGYAYIPNMQLYDGYSYHNIHTYVSYNIHRLRVDLSDHKDASDNTHNSINTYLNASYNWLRKYVLDAYTYSYNSHNNLHTYVLTTYTNLINAYTNLKDYTTTNIGRLDGKIDGLLETKDALVFRGTIHTFDSISNGFDFTPEHLTWNEVETNAEFGLSCGATFKVENDGWFFDKLVHAGDLIISISDSASKTSKEGWTIVEQHIDRLNIRREELTPMVDGVSPWDHNPPEVVVGISPGYLGGFTYSTYSIAGFFGDFGENDDIKHQISDTPTSYAKLLTGMTFKNGKLTYSYSTFYVDTINKAEMSEYAKLSDLSEFARGAYGLTNLIGKSNAGNKVVTNLYLETGTGYLTYDYTQLSASKNAGSNHDLKGGAITVVTGISQGGNGKITYHYQQISNSYNHHKNEGASGTANQSITNINISNTGKLTYVYRDLSTTTGAATSATATNVISNEIKVLTGLSQTSDGKITYTYTPIKGTHNHSHNHTYAFKFDSASNGAHTHNLTGASAVSNGAHTHTLTGTADSNGAHTHNITYTGTSSSNGSHNHTFTGNSNTTSSISGSSTVASSTHTHTLTPTGTISNANNHSHTYAFKFNSGETGSHNHTFTGNSNTTSSISGTTSVATAAHTHSTSSAGGHTPAGTVTLLGSETDGVLTITATFTGTAVEGHTHTANATADNTTNRVSVASSSHTHTLTPTGTIANAGNHAHSISYTGTSSSNGGHGHTFTGNSNTTASILGTTTVASSTHTHTLTPTGTIADGGSHSHTYAFKFDSSSNGAHTHNLTGASAVSNGAHTHTVTGTVDSNGAHTHNISYTGTTTTNG